MPIKDIFTGKYKWFWIVAVVVMLLAAAILLFNLGYSLGYFLRKLISK